MIDMTPEYKKLVEDYKKLADLATAALEQLLEDLPRDFIIKKMHWNESQLVWIYDPRNHWALSNRALCTACEKALKDHEN